MLQASYCKNVTSVQRARESGLVSCRHHLANLPTLKFTRQIFPGFFPTSIVKPRINVPEMYEVEVVTIRFVRNGNAGRASGVSSDLLNIADDKEPVYFVCGIAFLWKAGAMV